jgi:actin-like ATPase involved in cell morphogenesis
MADLFAGVDLGTTFTAAAVIEAGSSPEMVSLGSSGAVIPSVVLLRDDGTIATGHAAVQRGVEAPAQVAREFKRRVGDPAPVMVGGTPIAAHLLMGRLLRWVLERVEERHGAAPAHTVVTHPANWGDYKRDYLRQAAEWAGIGEWSPLTEPEAAAIHYASRERIEAGQLVAVYDLGGGTFDAAVLRRTGDGFEVVGNPQGIENLGGLDFDEALYSHVRSATGPAFADLDPDDPAVVRALRRLRDDVEAAKITLSTETDAAIPVDLPGHHTSVRVTRHEFEAMIRTPVRDTVAALIGAIAVAGVSPDDLAKVLLVGGSSRIPLIAQEVTGALHLLVAVDADPKTAVARGAAVAARTAARGSVRPAPEAEPGPEPAPVAAVDADPEPEPEPVEHEAPAPEPVPAGPPASPAPHPAPTPHPAKPVRRRRNLPWILGAVAAIIATAVIAVVASGNLGGDDETTTTSITAQGAPPFTLVTGNCNFDQEACWRLSDSQFVPFDLDLPGMTTVGMHCISIEPERDSASCQVSALFAVVREGVDPDEPISGRVMTFRADFVAERSGFSVFEFVSGEIIDLDDGDTFRPVVCHFGDVPAIGWQSSTTGEVVDIVLQFEGFFAPSDFFADAREDLHLPAEVCEFAFSL